MMRSKMFSSLGVMLAIAVTPALAAFAGTSAGNLSFTNKALTRPDGNSEPEISIAGNSTMAIVALGWLNFGTSLWTGPFGSTPTFQGLIDAALQRAGKQVFGGEDADVDMGTTGALHASTLIALGEPNLQGCSDWCFRDHVPGRGY